MPWSIDSWCEQQQPSDWSEHSHHASTVAFLNRLNLSSTHPFCSDEEIRLAYELPNVPGQGPLLSMDHMETTWDVIITIIAMGFPSLAAMVELWLRLLSSIAAPMGIAHMLYWLLTSSAKQLTTDSSARNDPTKLSQRKLGDSNDHSASTCWISFACLLTVSSATVLMTDTLYVLEYGPTYGCTMLLLSILLSLRLCQRFNLRYTQYGILVLVFMALVLVCDVNFDGTLPSLRFSFGDEHDAVKIEERLYFDESSVRSSTIVSYWSASSRSYTPASGATAWLPTGDSRTGIPFLINFVTTPRWTRVWLPLYDGEVVALDIAFPVNGHDISHPLYLVLHGLNGGSQEEYVKDFVVRRINEGSTVAVMIARGLMDLPVRGMNVFHGARWEDPHQASQQLRQAIEPGQLLAGVGYSMGAIILSNMVARTGPECALDVAVAVSGGLDMRQEINFVRAQRLWQPLLTSELRDTFVVGKWGERVRQRLSKDQMKALMRATHVSDIDKTAVVVYNGFRDLVHYYSEMSALGDVPFPSSEYELDQLPPSRRMYVTTFHRCLFENWMNHLTLKHPVLLPIRHNISIPLCVIHAFDDPLVTWRSVASNTGLMHPTNLTRTGTGNLFVLLTKRGGHVGFPLGWNPSIRKWKWMSDISMSFVQAVVREKAERPH